MKNRSSKMSRRGFPRICVAAAVMVGIFACGCDAVGNFLKTDKHRFLSPEKVVRPPAGGRPVNPIYDSIGPADTSQDLAPNATFPHEGDWQYNDSDYLIGPTDVLNISILDLFYEGVETPLQRVVSESGYISLPELPQRIRAEGLTIDQLRKTIVDAYRPNLLKNPIVSVTAAAKRQSVFSIMGAIASPGRYPLARRDMRLLEAISAAGGITQSNIRYIYVIRQSPAIRSSKPGKQQAKPSVAKPLSPQQLPALPAEAPQAKPQPTSRPAAETPALPPVSPPRLTGPAPARSPIPSEEIDINKALRELGNLEASTGQRPKTQPVTRNETPRPVELAGTAPATTSPAEVEDLKKLSADKSSKFIYTTTEGFVRVNQKAPVAATPSGAGTGRVAPAGKQAKAPAVQQQQDPFGWRKVDKSSMVRIIAIDLSKLREGNWRQNIIVRDDDVIQVPTLKVGEFYVMGEVRSPGAYNLTGRRLTVKQGIAAAGNFSPLAWPQNAVLYRRVGDNQEQAIPLDLDAIFSGEEPDIFLKPNDILAVGTDVRASFYAVMRNAFRMTYGFGFIYDRNFADPYTLPMDSKRFTRW